MVSVLAVLCVCMSVGAEDQGPVIDYGESELYTVPEREAAVDIIKAELASMEGVELHYVTYAGDDQSVYDLSLNNSLDKGTFDEGILFYTAFRSPKQAYGAWEADTEYTWSYSLARTNKGPWQLVNFGWPENYVRSERYSEDDMNAAVQTIYNEFDLMEGTKVYFMSYKGDEFSMNELDYVNSLDKGTFDECAVFTVWFNSPKEASGAWDADKLYTWSFYLARAAGGEWQVVTFGY